VSRDSISWKKNKKKPKKDFVFGLFSIERGIFGVLREREEVSRFFWLILSHDELEDFSFFFFPFIGGNEGTFFFRVCVYFFFLHFLIIWVDFVTTSGFG
jgi:hypothetical protein